ncbi:MAG: hypothetical protein FJ319_03465 [SAR202 cluster bacterium]|nr:hypothetical protein [SAR202 cluster bacterium]
MPGKNTNREHELELRQNMIRQWYGDRVGEERLKAIREVVEEEVIDIGEALRETPLKMTDEPQPLFTPYRKDG